MHRIEFKDSKIREIFFNNVRAKGGFSSWKEFRAHFKISKSSLENYKNGRLTIPMDRFNEMEKNIPDNLKVLYNDNITVKAGDWGRIKGGVNNYKKNKSIFDLGRKKALETKRKLYAISNESLQIDLTPKLAEVLGTFIGDGFFNKYNSSYFIQFAGDSRYDYDYYKNVIIPYINTIIPNKPYIRIKGNSMWITFYSKYLFYLLLKRFNMVTGKKVYTIQIPDEILNNKNLLKYTIRGIIDTDGCIYYDKRIIYKKPYLRIALSLSNKNLINQIKFALEDFGIRCGLAKRKDGIGFILQINGYCEVNKYIKLIGLSNTRHLNKLK